MRKEVHKWFKVVVRIVHKALLYLHHELDHSKFQTRIIRCSYLPLLNLLTFALFLGLFLHLYPQQKNFFFTNISLLINTITITTIINH